MKMIRLFKPLYVQVLVGLVLGIAVGHYWPEFGAGLKPFGDGFVKLVKMMIAPVVFCTIVSGITSLSDSAGIGRTLAKAMGLFYLLTIIALLTGLAAVLLLHPGTGLHIDPTKLDPAVAERFASKVPPRGFAEFALHLIPTSFFGAFAEGEVLPVLLLAVLCGFALVRIGAAARPVLQAIEGFSHMLFTAFGFIMRLAPLGAFGAMAFTVGRYGIHSIGSLGHLIFTFYVACGFFVVVVLGLLARLLMKLERLGCRRSVVGLVLPTGYSFNLDGTAIYLTLASLFIAQACDIHLSAGQIAALLGLMLLTSKGAAGVTGSGFVALVATLTVMPDLPVAGVALIVGIDRFMSEARALTSTISNIVACVVVSVWERACDRVQLKKELATGYVATEQALEQEAALPAAAPVLQGR